MTVRLLLWPDEQDKLYALRNKILRPGRPISVCAFPEDGLPTTRHFGAFDETGNLVGCATVLENDGLQLRGMATDRDFQGGGIGRAVLTLVHQYAQEINQPLWCNARVTAMGFYEKLGWVAEGEEFHVPDVGPHYIMRKATVENCPSAPNNGGGGGH
jgi:predicted GNAT family N-acyltransferase